MKIKRGRPKLPDHLVKRTPLNMRTTKEMRDRMQAAANASGRSLAMEVEFRLERSFMLDDIRAVIKEELAGE